MAAPMEKSEKCLLCHESLPKKSRRSLFVKEFAYMTQLVEVLGYMPQNNDTSSRYVCTFCFSKLNKLQKLDYDIVHILNRLKEEKMALLNIMRARFLTQPSVIDHENPLCGTAIQKTSLNNDASPLDVKNIDKCSTLQIFSNTRACSLSSVVDSSRSINTPTFPADVTSINQTATLPVAILHCPSFSVPKQIAIAPKPMATSTPIQIMSSKSGSHRRKRSPKLTPDLSTRKRKKSSPTNKMAVQLIRSTLEKETNDVKTFHQCVVCDEIFQQYSDLEAHNKIHVKEEKTGDIDNHNTTPVHVHNSKTDDMDENCPIHFEKLRTEGEKNWEIPVKEEQLGGEETYYECKLCGEIFHDHRGLEEHCKIHVKEESEPSSSHQCKICKVSFTRYCDLEVHVCRVINDTNLSDDIRIGIQQQKNKGFLCNFCAHSCKSKGHLNIHLRIHTGEKPFKCSLCSKAFIEKSKLNIHMRTHTGEKPYKCGVCGKSFNYKHSLQIHITTHTGEKPAHCDVCNKSFPSLGYLRKHKRIHTGEKPYKCNVCGMTFNDGSNLQKHAKTHSGVKPFKCDVCGKSFIQNSTLRIHIRTHTGEKPYKCVFCDMSFKDSSNLTKHTRTHSRDSNQEVSCSLPRLAKTVPKDQPDPVPCQTPCP